MTPRRIKVLMGYISRHWILGLLLLASAVIFYVFACPFFHDTGHPWVCWLFGALLLITVFYATSAVRVRGR